MVGCTTRRLAGGAVYNTVAAALHVVGSCCIFVAGCFVHAGGAGVVAALAQSVCPAVVVHIHTVVCSDAGGCGVGSWSSCDGEVCDGALDRCNVVGTVISAGLCGEFSDPFFVCFVEMCLEIIHDPILFSSIAPFIRSGGGEDTGLLKYY